jgi:hypothetical protein
MEITKVRKTCRVIEPALVCIGSITTESDDDLRDAAFKAAQESPTSCFGSRVDRLDGGRAIVSIFRD